MERESAIELQRRGLEAFYRVHRPRRRRFAPARVSGRDRVLPSPSARRARSPTRSSTSAPSTCPPRSTRWPRSTATRASKLGPSGCPRTIRARRRVLSEARPSPRRGAHRDGDRPRRPRRAGSRGRRARLGRRGGPRRDGPAQRPRLRLEGRWLRRCVHPEPRAGPPAPLSRRGSKASSPALPPPWTSPMTACWRWSPPTRTTGARASPAASAAPPSARPPTGGSTTSSLQASPLGRPVYERLGYESFGAIQMWERRDG